MAMFYPSKNDQDGFFDFLPAWFNEWGNNFFHNMNVGPFAADVQETKDAYIVKVDLPGFDKENIELNYEQGVLTVNASRNQETNEKAEDASFIRKERVSGAYARRFALEGVDEENITASFKDGVLNVTLGKKTEADKPNKRITIN
ncbi:Hsp20/alpha crystallin family protein [Bacillaceae bacterium Marseille-Q3522]|nr:Hsp20/alpha crystallin family protein [Bacillaceae bacterium Marseille-Q3522]